MSASATFTTGDTAPDLTGTVNADLTGATAELHMRKRDGAILTVTAAITDAATGAWSYTWQAGDLDAPGEWAVELQVTFSDGQIQTFGPQLIRILDQIA